MPSIWVEGNYRRVRVGDLTLYFSYSTVVGFYYDGATVVCQNAWGPTTGKHLNAIDGGNKAKRLPIKEFTARLEALLAAVMRPAEEVSARLAA